MQVVLDSISNEKNTYNCEYSKNKSVLVECKNSMLSTIYDKSKRDIHHAYRSQGKTTTDVVNQAKNTDVKTMQNQMIMMSHCVSTKDFSKMCKDGFSPKSMDVEEYVTVVDRIKVIEAKCGNVIAGYNDDLSKECIEEVTNSVSLTATIKEELDKNDLRDTPENEKKLEEMTQMGMEIKPIGDETKKYLIENGSTLSVENIYRAQFSGSISGKQAAGYFDQDGTGYLARKAYEGDRQIADQELVQRLEEMDVELSEKSLSNARYLMQEGIPVTKENVELANLIDEIDVPENEREWIQVGCDLLKNGIEPKSGDISKREDIVKQSLDEYEKVEKKLIDGSLKDNNVQFKRELEEVRLHMTSEALVRMQRLGVHVDTLSLSDLVDSLKVVENEIRESLFPGEEKNVGFEKMEQLATTEKVLREIPAMPISMVAYGLRNQDASLRDYYEEGQLQIKAYASAKESYETFMTVARTDLGDSMKKAFRNMEAVLEEAGIDTSVSNQRAARILAYNHLEITNEAVELVKEADEKLQYIMKEINPAMVLSMLRKGKKPLEMPLDQLQKEVDEYNATSEVENQRFSKFLYELDQKKGITEEERENFLDIYRVFKSIEKTDGAAIGAMLEQGSDYTLENLRTLSKSTKKQIDFTTSENDIVKNSFSRDVKLVYHSLTVKGLSEIADLNNVTLQEMKDLVLQEMEPNTQVLSENSYENSELEQMVDASRVSEFVFQKCVDSGVTINADNLLAVKEMTEKRGSMYRRFEEMMPGILLDEIEKVQEAFEESEEPADVYKEFLNMMESELSKQIDEVTGFLDLKAINQVMKQVQFCKKIQTSQEYEVPIQFGDSITSLHITFVKARDGKSEVSVTTQLDKIGKIGANFCEKKGMVEGYIATETKQGKRYFEAFKEKFAARLELEGYDHCKVNVIEGNKVVLENFEDYQSKNKAERNDNYLKITRAFIGTMREVEMEDLYESKL